MPNVPCDNLQPVIECGRRNQQIGAAVADPGGELSPAPRDPHVDREDAIPASLDGAVEPRAKRLGEDRFGQVLR